MFFYVDVCACRSIPCLIHTCVNMMWFGGTCCSTPIGLRLQHVLQRTSYKTRVYVPVLHLCAARLEGAFVCGRKLHLLTMPAALLWSVLHCDATDVVHCILKIYMADVKCGCHPLAMTAVCVVASMLPSSI
jgi:hypothetical protein